MVDELPMLKPPPGELVVQCPKCGDYVSETCCAFQSYDYFKTCFHWINKRNHSPDIGDAIIAGIASGDGPLDQMSEIVSHLERAGFVIVQGLRIVELARIVQASHIVELARIIEARAETFYAHDEPAYNFAGDELCQIAEAVRALATDAAATTEGKQE